MQKKKSTNVYFLIVVTVLMLQALRNINLFIYAFCLLMSYVALYMNYPIRSIIYKKYLWWFFLYSLLPVVSIINGIAVNEFFTAMIRYCALYPFVFWAITHLDIVKQEKKNILKIYVFVTTLAALLMIYQLFFGKLYFFEEVTERVGYARYSSLLGSPTSYGTLSPLAILSMFYFNLFEKNKKIIFSCIIFIGGAICLSKAFFVNFGICTMFIIYNFLKMNGNSKLTSNKIIKVLVSIFLVLCIGFILFKLFSLTIFGDYLEKMFNYSFNNEYNGVNADLLDRLTDLPKKAFEYHKLETLQFLFGIGFIGYSGIMGLPMYPMCHNDYFSVILSQGIAFFIVFYGLYCMIMKKCIENKNLENRFLIAICVYELINMFAGQWNYLVTCNMIFLMILFTVFVEKKDSN